MSKPAAIAGSFSDFKLIKTRSTAQLIIEIPIEAADEALRILGGVPQSGKENPVAIARLKPRAALIADDEATTPLEPQPSTTTPFTQHPMPEYGYQMPVTGNVTVRAPSQAPEKPASGRNEGVVGKRRWEELSRAARAGIRCGETAFATFLQDKYPTWVVGQDYTGRELDVAATLRRICGVDSRRKLDTDDTARLKFDRLDDEYVAWMTAP